VREGSTTNNHPHPEDTQFGHRGQWAEHVLSTIYITKNLPEARDGMSGDFSVAKRRPGARTGVRASKNDVEMTK